MVTTPTLSIINSWVSATWDEYLANIENYIYEKAKGYYYNYEYRIEMTPIGNDHSQDHAIINHAIYLYATIKNIPLNGKDNCSYRQPGVFEIQPDLSYYIGDNANAIPWGTGIVDISQYPAPNLVIEVSNTSLSDDLGKKRLLYEDLGIAEYWIIDVQNVQVIAFKIENQGSKRIQESQVLPGLEIKILTEALERSRNSNHTTVSSWLLQQFQQ
ncbi:MAG: Uma2 family endonuclease [Xenococcaceae cyanobacterium MO_167.B27]|nr:Uma2 family endonuclease [Xenococcaceae cyanobacterium MO_167.B27]